MIHLHFPTICPATSMLAEPEKVLKISEKPGKTAGHRFEAPRPRFYTGANRQNKQRPLH